MSYECSRHYENEKCLLELRKRILDAITLTSQRHIIESLTEFNKTLRGALFEMYQHAHKAYEKISAHIDNNDEMELTACCYLDNTYPKLHPIQNENRQDLWDALQDSAWNPLYESGISHEFILPRDLGESFESFIGMDCPPPNWNEGLDPELTKDMHLISQFHNLFDHTHFALTDFIYIRKFRAEINIEIIK